MLDPVWPTRCAGCDARGRGALCPFCRASLHLQTVHLEVGPVAGAVAAAPYASPLGRAVRRAKYGRDARAMQWLARAFAATVGPWAAGGFFEAVVPVPSPWTRRVQRGFAPAAVLAAALGRATGIEVVGALAARPGPRQARLDLVERWENPRRRLRARGPCPARVLLVDDVVTTGATTACAARLLHGVGGEQVWVAALCVSELRRDAAEPTATSPDGTRGVSVVRRT